MFDGLDLLLSIVALVLTLVDVVLAVRHREYLRGWSGLYEVVFGPADVSATV